MASIWAEHPLHGPARDWVLRSRAGDVEAVICQHSLMEVFASLTGMPSRPRLGPALVRAALDETCRTIGIVEIGVEEYRTCLQLAERLGLSGGVVYDLLILRAAEQARVDHLVTANSKHFSRLRPDDAGFVVSL